MGQAILLDAQIIKSGFVWSLATMGAALVLMCVYFACVGPGINVVYMTMQMSQVLMGAMTNALLTLAEYQDRCHALAKQEEARVLLV